MGSFARWSNIARHGNLSTTRAKGTRSRETERERFNQTHELARHAWEERLLQAEVASGSGGGAKVAVYSEAASAKGPPTTVRTNEPTTGYRAVIATRALLEVKGSFRSLDVWYNALPSDQYEALGGSRGTGSRELVNTMAQHERNVTHSLLKEGAVFRLQADGLDRIYQVEIGTVLWKLPASLQLTPLIREQATWLETLGPNGPWVAERLIGMHEFPSALDCNAKVSMLESCVRQAAVSANGEVDPTVFKHVREEMRVWTSDGADREVAAAASATFRGLKFDAWDESHSAQKLLAAVMKEDEEIVTTDALLVSGKNPPSLAKFISTSLVFRKTVEDSQVEEEVAFFENWGWAPHRYSSRARPYKRHGRRWNSLFKSLATEAAESADQKRRILAKMFLGELGGEHSCRVLLGGLIGDLSLEHYRWVATGDKSYPDPATAEARMTNFLDRLQTLYMDGMILTMPDTLTGIALEFLKDVHIYRYGNKIQRVGIGDWMRDPLARDVIKQTLHRMQVVVKNIQVYMKVYRSKKSWLHAFTAFRLPSPASSPGALRTCDSKT